MPIEFRVLKSSEPMAPTLRPVVYLNYDNWDDYSYKTLFLVAYMDASGPAKIIGSLKIGHVGQTKGKSIDELTKSFTQVPQGWFSLGQDVEYYKNLRAVVPSEYQEEILRSLRDVVLDDKNLQLAKDEEVFLTSLTRNVSMSVILGQYRRVLTGNVELTDFNFRYCDPGDNKNAPVDLAFKVKATLTPSTNMHVLIGRNGVGKTTLLNNMVGAILNVNGDVVTRTKFTEIDDWDIEEPISSTYFSSLISVSFSAFDPFVPPPDRPDRSHGTAYFYIGMKKARAGGTAPAPLAPKSDIELGEDLASGLLSCLNQPEKRDRWLKAIARLQSDENFSEMELEGLAQLKPEAAATLARSLVRRMSSGHAIVLLTITKLVEYVEEKTLVLMDEPESHLHPPLLSAFMRALSDLLHNRNGVAIIATHSPVVVQEVPRTCVWKLNRLGNQGRADRPERESFGENVGVLTREIFGLEVSKSGFHEMLENAVATGGSYESILLAFNGQLGHEAKSILLSLVNARDSSSSISQ